MVFRRLVFLVLVLVAGMQAVHAMTDVSTTTALNALQSNPNAVLIDTRTEAEHNGYDRPDFFGGALTAGYGAPVWNVTVNGTTVTRVSILVPLWATAYSGVNPEDPTAAKEVIEKLLAAGVIDFDTPIYLLCKTAWRSHFFGLWLEGKNPADDVDDPNSPTVHLNIDTDDTKIVDPQRFYNARTGKYGVFTQVYDVDADGDPLNGAGGIEEWIANGLPVSDFDGDGYGDVLFPQVIAYQPGNATQVNDTAKITLKILVIDPVDLGNYPITPESSVSFYFNGAFAGSSSTTSATGTWWREYSLDVTVPSPGTYTWGASATSTNGTGYSQNVYNAMLNVTFTVADTKAPQITPSSTYLTVIKDSSATVSWTISEAFPVSYWIEENGTQVDSGTYTDGQTITYTVNTSVLGVWNYTLYANDTTGKVSASEVTVEVIQDTEPPTVTIQQPAEGATVNDSVVTLKVAVVDASIIDYINYSLDGGAWVNFYSQKGERSTVAQTEIFIPADGAHTLEVVAADVVGNNITKSVNFTVTDTTPPATSIASPRNMTYGWSWAMLNLSFSEPVTQINVNWSNGYTKSYSCSNCTSFTAYPGEPNNVTTGRVGYWSLNDGSGTTAADAEGNADLTLSGGASWVNGILGPALSFDGSTGYASNADVSGVIDNTSLAFALWFKVNTVAPAAQQLVHLNNSVTSPMSLVLKGDRLEFWVTNGTDWAGLSYAGIAPGQWYFLVAEFRSGTLNIYLNGTLVNTSAASFTELESTAPISLYVGARNAAPVDRFLDGTIDDLAMYSPTSLTPTQVGDLYTQGTLHLLPDGDAWMSVSPVDTRGNAGAATKQYFLVYTGSDPTPPSVSVVGNANVLLQAGSTYSVTWKLNESYPTTYYVYRYLNGALDATLSSDKVYYDGMSVTVPVLTSTTGNYTYQLVAWDVGGNSGYANISVVVGNITITAPKGSYGDVTEVPFTYTLQPALAWNLENVTDHATEVVNTTTGKIENVPSGAHTFTVKANLSGYAGEIQRSSTYTTQSTYFYVNTTTSATLDAQVVASTQVVLTGSVSGTLTLSNTTDNPVGDKRNLSQDYPSVRGAFYLNVSSNLSGSYTALLKIFYKDYLNNLDETTLSIYRYDPASNRWVKLDSYVSTYGGYVYAELTGFSLFAVGGEIAKSVSLSPPGGGKGGVKTIKTAILTTADDWRFGVIASAMSSEHHDFGVYLVSQGTLEQYMIDALKNYDRVIILGDENIIPAEVETQLLGLEHNVSAGFFGLEVERLPVKDIYEASTALAELCTHDKGYILVRDDLYPDSFVASAIAVVWKKPVLFTGTNEIPDEVFNFLKQKKLPVTIIGGPEAVSEGVADALRAQGIAVTRIGGEDRYETAALVAEEFLKLVPAKKTLLVDGENDEWVNTAGIHAGENKQVLLFIKDMSLPPATLEVLERHEEITGAVVAAMAGLPEILFEPLKEELENRGMDMSLMKTDTVKHSVQISNLVISRLKAAEGAAGGAAAGGGGGGS